MNITDDYISYEVAKLLKNKGFPFDDKGIHTIYRPTGEDDTYVACTQALAMKWLREVHRIAIIPDIHTTSNGYCWASCIYELAKPFELVYYFSAPDSGDDGYKDTIERALIYVLKKLI